MKNKILLKYLVLLHIIIISLSNFLVSIPIEIIGVNTYSSTNETIIEKEEKSLESFEKTFSSIDFNNNQSIYNCLLEKHPYYNGQIYPKLY